MWHVPFSFASGPAGGLSVAGVAGSACDEGTFGVLTSALSSCYNQGYFVQHREVQSPNVPKVLATSKTARKKHGTPS